MRGAAIAIAAVILFALGALALLAGGQPPEGPTSPVPSPTRRPPTLATPIATPTDPGIVASAVVVPRRSADLAMPITGRVTAVPVTEHDEVFTGELLVRVDQSTRQAAVDVATADVERAEAAVDRAELQLEQLPPDASLARRESAEADLRLAEAELAVARTTLAEAELALAQTELRAPFAGTVASVDVAVGEQAIAGQPIISLGDLSAWYIQTTDLSELEVVRLAVGDPAEVTFGSMPGRVVRGSVDQIQVRGTPQQGGVRFDVLIELDEHDPDLRWNMSATVRITPTN